MRLANLAGRLVVVTERGAVDVAAASGGRFGPDPQDALADWPGLLDWATGVDWTASPDPAAGAVELDPARLGPVVPRPRQVFAVGVNYRQHAAESGLSLPEQPMIFTKFPSCLTGPAGDIELPSAAVDWEIELVVVVGRAARAVPPAEAWAHVAGFTIGQDLSERVVQMRGPAPQFSMAKSYPGFGPVGPYLTTLDELADPADLTLTCSLNGTVMQQSSTRDMVFDVPALIGYLSGICRLYPGDLIFTGTPPGVGMARTPPRYLVAGDVLESRIDGLGSMRHRCVAAGAAPVTA